MYAKLWHGYDDAAPDEVRCVDVVPMCAAAVAVWTLLFVAFFLNPSYVWAALTVRRGGRGAARARAAHDIVAATI